jgi:hypothetical protein
MKVREQRAATSRERSATTGDVQHTETIVSCGTLSSRRARPALHDVITIRTSDTLRASRGSLWTHEHRDADVSRAPQVELGGGGEDPMSAREEHRQLVADRRRRWKSLFDQMPAKVGREAMVAHPHPKSASCRRRRLHERTLDRAFLEEASDL